MMQTLLTLIEEQADRIRFEDIYNGYYKQMLMVAGSVLDNTADAEDAVQDALLRIARNIAALRNREDWAIRGYVLTVAKNAALAITVFAIPDVRDTVIRFFVQDQGDRYEFSFDPEQAATAPKYIEKTYRASYIPEGFTEMTVDSSLSGCCRYWRDTERNTYIMFDQTVIGGIDKVPYGDESVSEVLNLNGYQVFCVRDEAIKYFWTDNEYFFSLYCGQGITEAEMRKIFCGFEVDQ